MKRIDGWGSPGRVALVGALAAGAFWAFGAMSRPAHAQNLAESDDLAQPASSGATPATPGADALQLPSDISAPTRWPDPEELERVNQGRLARQSRGMGVLLGWSVLNIGLGTAGYLLDEGPALYFHQMNAGWNVVNAAIAGFGLRGALRTDASNFNGLQTLEEGRSFERILAINIGLNVAYMTTGAFMWERGTRLNDVRLRGYGPSLVMQGAFLLIFDSTLFALQQRASAAYLDGLALSAGPEGGMRLGYSTSF